MSCCQVCLRASKCREGHIWCVCHSLFLHAVLVVLGSPPHYCLNMSNTTVESCLPLQAAAKEGDTAPPPLEDEVDFGYAALVNKNNRLVELDGSKSFPIDHGKTSDNTILQV